MVGNYMLRILVFFIFLVFFISFKDIFARGQEVEDRNKTGSSGARPANLFIINDKNNEIANKSVTIALKAMRDQHPDWLGKIVTVEIDGANATQDLDDICSAWDSAIKGSATEVPDMVLDTTTSGFPAETVNSFTFALGIPTLSGQFGQEGDLRRWREMTSDQKQYLIQVMPPADLIPEAIRQLAIKTKIGNAAVVFDKSFVMDHKYKSLLLNVPTRHVIVQAKDTDEKARHQLSQFRELDLVNYFVLGDEKTLTMELDAAQMLNFTGRKYSWYALTQDDFVPKCECKNLSLIFFKPQHTANSQQRISELSSGSLPKPHLTSAFYYDLTRLGITAIYSAIRDSHWPREPKHISCDAYNESNTPVRTFNFLQALKNESKELTFEPTFGSFAWGTKNGEHCVNFDMSVSIINISNGNTVSNDQIGTWPAGLESPFPDNGTNVAKDHVAVTSYRVVTVVKPPFIMYDAETDTWSGYCIDLMDEIRQILHFEYEITEAPDKQFGSMDEQGNWSGMIKELKDKRADIALGALSVMAERENVVDFTVPYYDLVGISILMMKPKSETSLFKFLTVLENDVWLCILASYFFTSLLMWLFDRWSPYSYQNNREKYADDEEKREFNLKECLWFCMTSLTPQGGGEAPKNLSGRLVAATWWLFGFIIIASYTANLAAFLTVSRLETPIESLDDLSKQYKVQYAPRKNSEAYTYFERMSNIETRFYEIWKDMSLNDSLTDVERAKLAVWDYPVSDKYTKMFQAMKEAGFPESMEEAIKRVRRQDPNNTNEFAFIGDATDVKYLSMVNCDLITVGDEFSRKPYAIAVQQGSPLKDQLNNAILQLLNKRKLEKLKNKWWNQNPAKVSCAKQEDQSDGISIQNIGGVFIVIFVGIGLACVTLAFEYWWYRYRPNQEAKRNAMAKAPPARNVKPIKFTLKPARTSGPEPNLQFRSRF